MTVSNFVIIQVNVSVIAQRRRKLEKKVKSLVCNESRQVPTVPCLMVHFEIEFRWKLTGILLLLLWFRLGLNIFRELKSPQSVDCKTFRPQRPKKSLKMARSIKLKCIFLEDILRFYNFYIMKDSDNLIEIDKKLAELWGENYELLKGYWGENLFDLIYYCHIYW